jgi:hypothetical protein
MDRRGNRSLVDAIDAADTAALTDDEVHGIELIR